jgi:NAD(P)H-hydrate epimerase
LAVYIHGLAGDIAMKEKGAYSMMASDIIASIEKVINK